MLDFGRVITAMVTPFDDQGALDLDRAAKLIDWLIEEQETDGLVVCGTTGESPTLTDEEKMRLLEFTVRHVRKRCKVIAGTGSYNTAHSIELSQKAQELGADGLLLVAPYYNRPTQEGLYRHFRAIAESVRIPVMLYNVPKRTGVNISAETTIALSQIPNIVATKEASGDLDQAARIISGAKQGFRVYSGDDNQTLPLLAVGGYGVVSVASHVVGKPIQQMIRSFVDGNVQEAARLHRELLPVFSGMFICPNPVPVKYALNLHGVQVGDVRLPLVPATEQEQAQIRALFAQPAP